MLGLHKIHLITYTTGAKLTYSPQ